MRKKWIVSTDNRDIELSCIGVHELGSGRRIRVSHDGRLESVENAVELAMEIAVAMNQSRRRRRKS